MEKILEEKNEKKQPKNLKVDMTKGNPFKLIFFFTMPILVGQLFQQLYFLVDSAIVGKTLGNEVFAAVSLTNPIAFLIIGFVAGLTSGLAVIASQHFGSKDYNGVRKSVATSIIICAGAAIVLTVLGCVFAKPLLRLINTGDNYMDNSYAYLIMIYSGMIATVFYNLLSALIRALGDSKTPLYFLIIASVLNIGLDFLFILVFKMGAMGAGFATVLSQFISAILSLIYMRIRYKDFMPKKADWKVSMQSVIKHCKIALPMGLQMSIMSIGMIGLQSVINKLDDGFILTGYSAAVRIDQLLMQPMMSFGLAMATYIAQNTGAHDVERVRKGVFAGTIFAIGSSIVTMTIAIALGRFIIPLFLEENIPEIIDVGKYYLSISGWFYPALGILFLFRNTLQGMGRPLFPFISCGIELFARLGGAFILADFFGFEGVCFSSPLSWFSAGLALLISYMFVMHKIKRKGLYSVSADKENLVCVSGEAETFAGIESVLESNESAQANSQIEQQ